MTALIAPPPQSAVVKNWPVLVCERVNEVLEASGEPPLAIETRLRRGIARERRGDGLQGDLFVQGFNGVTAPTTNE